MQFSDAFRTELSSLMQWRRDVREFKTDPVDEALVDQCLDAFLTAPSVGLSEPWRILRVRSETARENALKNFNTANAQALGGYQGAQKQKYASLKLSGMRDAPVQFAVYCDDSTEQGSGLGATSMPEMRRYSVVCAVFNFWLYCRSLGLGLGWVSILDPDQLNTDLNADPNWSLIGYFCMGWPKNYDDTPALERAEWEQRRGHLIIEDR